MYCCTFYRSHWMCPPRNSCSSLWKKTVFWQNQFSMFFVPPQTGTQTFFPYDPPYSWGNLDVKYAHDNYSYWSLLKRSVLQAAIPFLLFLFFSFLFRLVFISSCCSFCQRAFPSIFVRWYNLGWYHLSSRSLPLLYIRVLCCDGSVRRPVVLLIRGHIRPFLFVFRLSPSLSCSPSFVLE